MIVLEGVNIAGGDDGTGAGKLVLGANFETNLRGAGGGGTLIRLFGPFPLSNQRTEEQRKRQNIIF